MMAASTDQTLSQEEIDLGIAFLLKLKNPLIIEFLSPFGGKKPANKAEMKERLIDLLASETLKPEGIFDYLDRIEGWGKQHCIIYAGGSAPVEDWRNETWGKQRIEQAGYSQFVNAKIQLAMPDELQLSSIEYDGKVLRILAVERREGAVRDSELDELDTRDDDKVIFKAYRFLVYRGFIAFEWDLVLDEAFIQITQLPTGEKYEDAISRFEKLLNGLLEVKKFHSISLSPVISKLHELEEKKIPEARSHGVAYRTPQGRTLEGRGAVGTQGLLGEEVIDRSMASVRKVGIGHTGNYYWLPFNINSMTGNILTDEVHVALIGEWDRINFTVLYPENQVRYVLQRIRKLASNAS